MRFLQKCYPVRRLGRSSRSQAAIFIQLRQKADIKLFDLPENIPLRPAYALPAPGQRKCRPKGDMCLFFQGRRMVFAKSKI